MLEELKNMIKYTNLDLENFEKHYIYLVILREVFFSTHQRLWRDQVKDIFSTNQKLGWDLGKGISSKRQRFRWNQGKGILKFSTHQRLWREMEMYMEKSPHISNSGRKWKGKLLHTAGIKNCRGTPCIFADRSATNPPRKQNILQ